MEQLNRHESHTLGRPQPRDSLVDVLDRVLDKGVVIAGDIVISLLDIELLTIKVRLLIASADKAREMGIDWWQHDPQLSSAARTEQSKSLERENQKLRDQLERMEARLRSIEHRSGEQGSAGHAPAKHASASSASSPAPTSRRRAAGG